MSTWGLHGADNPLFGWSSFDEMVWNEFEESGDHIVPETQDLTTAAWTSKGDCRKKSNPLTAAKFSDQSFQKLPKSVYSGLESTEEAFTDLNTSRKAGPPVNETVPVSLGGVGWSEFTAGSLPGISDARISDTTNTSVCLSSMSNEEDGVGMDGSRGIESESTDYEFEGVEGLCKDDAGYQDSDADIVNGSCHFLLSDICPLEGDLAYFGGEQEEVKGGNLLEYGWGNANNLEDMDNLFLNEDPLLPQVFNDGPNGMLWASSSPGTGVSPPGSIYQPIRTQLSPESRALKGDPKGFETKMEFVPCENLSTSMEIDADAGLKEQNRTGLMKLPVVSNLKANLKEPPLQKPMEKHMAQPIDDEERAREGKPPGATEKFQVGLESIEEDTQTSKGAEKTNKARRHAASRKREDRSKKLSSERKLAPSSYNYPQGGKSQLQYMSLRIQPPSSTLQAFPSPSTPISQVTHNIMGESPSSRQCPQPVPYVHAGFGFPAHHMPVVAPSPSVVPQQLQQAQPVFISYQPPLVDASKPQQGRNSYETSSQPPVRSSTMTPQEKIEKLRWRQKMQARLAVEQQQQQLINQHLMLEQKQIQKHQHQAQLVPKSPQEAASGAVRLVHTPAAEPRVWNEGSVTKTESTVEEEDDSLAATVLHQLISTASKLDTRTRLCLRDGFRRLAKSAMQRRAVGDSSASSTDPQNGSGGPESSSSSEQSSSSRRVLTVEDMVETETNPIDRSIAHLLFHKRCSPPVGPVYMPPSACAGIPETSQAVLLTQNPWAWQTGLPPSDLVGVPPAAGASVTPPADSGLTLINLQRASESSRIVLDAPVSSNSCMRLGSTPVCVPSSIAPDLGLEGSSPVQPEVIPSGLLPVVGSKVVCGDSQALSGYKSINGSTRTRHGGYVCSEGAVVPASQGCLQEHKQVDHIITEKRFPSNGLALDGLLQVDQKEAVLSAALDDDKLLHLVSGSSMASNGSLRHIKKEEGVEMMEVDIVSEGCNISSVRGEGSETITEPQIQVKEEMRQ